MKEQLLLYRAAGQRSAYPGKRWNQPVFSPSSHLTHTPASPPPTATCLHSPRSQIAYSSAPGRPVSPWVGHSSAHQHNQQSQLSGAQWSLVVGKWFTVPECLAEEGKQKPRALVLAGPGRGGGGDFKPVASPLRAQMTSQGLSHSDSL